MITRRGFLTGLLAGGAALAFDPHRVIFDMGRGLYVPKPIDYRNLVNELNALTREYIQPQLADMCLYPYTPGWAAIRSYKPAISQLEKDFG